MTINEIQDVSLGILKNFDAFCREKGICYWLSEGTLLGAIRHHGFIPWDDDVDVSMMRDDYEKLIKLANRFDGHYFLQYPGCEDGYGFSFVRLCNSKTTSLSKVFAYQKFNQGIALDIFPLDKVKMSDSQAIYDEVNLLNRDNSTCMRMNNPNLCEADKIRIAECVNKDIVLNQMRINELVQTFNRGEYDRIGTLTYTGYTYDRNCFREEVYSSTLLGEFEGLRFPIPSGYDEILTTTFGDYSKFPPIEERGSWHFGKIIDPDVSYTEYIKL